MEEIKVGEYARTEEGEIFKVIEEEVDFYNFQIKKLKPKEIFNPIVKHSSNIIDLIKDGDFITLYEHGCPVLITNLWRNREYNPKDHNIYEDIISIEINNNQIFENIKNDNNFKIYSIVTKEQFKNIEYKLDN